MTELEYAIRHRGFALKEPLKFTRRGFAGTLLSGLAAAAATTGTGKVELPGEDFTIAIIPDPQYLAESCGSGSYYTAMMQWIVENRHMVLKTHWPFSANIKAVVGVGDCVNAANSTQFTNAENAWSILDQNGIAFTTPPGNHDYAGSPSTRSNLGTQFTSGFFSAGNRSAAYGAGISLGGSDRAYWIGSFDTTGANTAVKFVISGIPMLVFAMDFFAGLDAWSWAYDVSTANADCECYITTHAWLTMNGAQFQRTDGYGPQAYSMASPPYSYAAEEAWQMAGVSTWPNLVGIFGGHDLDPCGALSPAWFWQRTPIVSSSPRRQTVQQLFVNAQNLDNACSSTVSMTNGAGQMGNVFLLSRRPRLGVIEGRMISTQSRNWFQSRSELFPNGGNSWSASETLLFSVPFPRLHPS